MFFAHRRYYHGPHEQNREYASETPFCIGICQAHTLSGDLSGKKRSKGGILFRFLSSSCYRSLVLLRVAMCCIVATHCCLQCMVMTERTTAYAARDGTDTRIICAVDYSFDSS